MVDYVRYEHDFKDDAIDFLAEYIPGVPRDERRKLFEWVYENNPFTDKPLNYLALEGERIVGFRGFIPQRFKVNGKTFIVIIPTNGTIHPDHRRKGVFTELSNYSLQDISNIDEIKLILSLSPNKAAVGALTKAGYIPLGIREKLYLFSTLKIMRNSPLKKMETEGSFVTVNGPDLRTEFTREPRIKGISELIASVSSGEKIENVRDTLFYEWRFVQSPHDTFFLYCMDGDELVGYMALERHDITFRSIMDLHYYMILEYGYVQMKHLECMIDTIKNKLNLNGVMAFMFTRGNEERTTFIKHRFKEPDMMILKFLSGAFDISRILDVDLPGAMIKPVTEKDGDRGFVLYGKDTRKVENWSIFRSDVH